jgi:hypothetical protein
MYQMPFLVSLAIAKGNSCREINKICFCIGGRLWKNLENSGKVLGARNNSKTGVDGLKFYRHYINQWNEACCSLDIVFDIPLLEISIHDGLSYYYYYVCSCLKRELNLWISHEKLWLMYWCCGCAKV